MKFKHLSLIVLFYISTHFTHVLIGQNLPNWMTYSKSIISDIPIHNLAIPGSHDAGMYKVETLTKLAPDVKDGMNKYFTAGGLAYSSGWAKTQELSIYNQLKLGIRYLDLRVCMDGNTIKFCHSYYGPTYQEIFTDITKFLDEHPDEIIILGFNHFWDYSFQNKYKLKKGENEGEGLTDNNLSTFLNMINQHFMDRIVPFDKTKENGFNSTSTLGEIWSAKKSKKENQVILLFNKSKFNKIPTIDLVNNRVDFWWDQTEDNYFNEQSKQKFLDKTQKYLNKSSTKITTLRSCVTPNNDMYGKGADITGTYPSNLKELADDTNPIVLDYIYKSGQSKHHNLLWADFVHTTDLVPLALYLNHITSCKDNKGNIVKIKPTYNTKKSNWGNWKLGITIFLEESLQAVNTAKDYVSDGVNEIIEWFDDPFSNKKVKANPPNNGITIPNQHEDLIQYRVTLDKIKVLNTGNDDVTGTKELELYGAINIIPRGNVFVNHGANKYLWHKSSDQKKSIKKDKSITPGTYKDIFGLKEHTHINFIDVKVKLKEHDGSNGDDDLKGQLTIPLSAIASSSKYDVIVRDGSQKCKVFLTIKKVK